MKVPASKATERTGVSAVALKFERDFGWSFREQPINDTGIDAHVEVVEQGVSTGRLLALQIKSGESYLRERTSQGILFRGKPRHLNYWLAHSLPVILVLYDPKADVAYWQSITTHTIERTGKGWKVSVPLAQTLSSPSISTLLELAQGDPYELVLRRFQLERPWMEITLSGGRLLLEVDEWVNKSSGRGDFRLRAEDPSGKEVLVRDWPIVLFPGMDYEDVLPTLFPWADLSIDEITYEQYDEDQFLTQTGIWDSEDDRYILTESFGDWSALHIRPGLRPYFDDGEVAHWRLELALNDLGRAFLAVDGFIGEYLREGEAHQPLDRSLGRFFERAKRGKRKRRLLGMNPRLSG